MREIKFRAWDTPGNPNGMYADGSSKVTEGEMLYGEDMPGAHCCGGGPSDINALLSEAERCGYIYMQYSGLKDKSKTEVYADDFIQHNENVYLIAWSENILGFVARRTGNEQNWRDGRWLIKCMKHCKVIGNSFENPELSEVPE